MSREITHRQGRQIVSSRTLRSVLRGDGEACYCAPDDTIEWDAGVCPRHDIETRQDIEESNSTDRVVVA